MLLDRQLHTIERRTRARADSHEIIRRSLSWTECHPLRPLALVPPQRGLAPPWRPMRSDGPPLYPACPCTRAPMYGPRRIQRGQDGWRGGMRSKESKEEGRRRMRQQEGGELLKRRGRVIFLRFAIEIHPFQMKLQPAPV